MAEKIYISSTYTDLKDFRQAIINCVLSLNQVGNLFSLVSMEFYDAEDLHFVEKCLNDVEECDIYILILAKRYGYRPKGYAKTITELEYEKAIACKQAGQRKEILVFRVGDMCDTYHYQADDNYKEMLQGFIDTVSEYTGSEPFDSAAELCLNVSHALMKRLFKRIKQGDTIVLPDSSAINCYCDRAPQFHGIRSGMLSGTKRMFFIPGKRKHDYPVGLVKRFLSYTLGASEKVEPIIQIEDMFSTASVSQNYAFLPLIQYLNILDSNDSVEPTGFIKSLEGMKTRKIILPFCFDFDFEDEHYKLSEFLAFANNIWKEYDLKKPLFKLYMMVFLYSEAKDAEQKVKAFMDGELSKAGMSSSSFITEKLKDVKDQHITDWFEMYYTTAEYSSSLYDKYFNEPRRSYTMREVNEKLLNFRKDLINKKEDVIQYLI